VVGFVDDVGLGGEVVHLFGDQLVDFRLRKLLKLLKRVRRFA